MTDIAAFPSHGSMGEVAQEGMTLRAYLAAKAMVIVAVAAEHEHVGPDEIAAACVEYADALLYALEMPAPVRANYEVQLSNAHARGDRMRDALRALQRVCAESNDGLEDDPVNREKYLAAMSVAEALLDDDENIPF